MRTALLWVALLGFLSASGAQAAAKKPASVNNLVHEAERLYQQGRYAESAERLKEANSLSPNPRLVYNIARAYDQAGELDLALQYYQQYEKSSEGTDPTLLKRSALAIDRIHGLISERDKRKQASDEEQAKLKAQAEQAHQQELAQAEAAKKARAEQEAQAQAVAEAQAHAESRSRVLSYVAGGVAATGLAVGIGCGLAAHSAKNDFSQASTVEQKLSFQNTTQHRALYADIGFGVAIASAVSAYFLWPKHTGGTQVVVAPAAGPSGGGLAVGGSF